LELMSNFTETAEQLRLVHLAGERFLALWAAESILDAPPAWDRLEQSLKDLAAGSDTQSLGGPFRADP